jgi:glycerol-3-phosphate dehydrogenase
MMTKLTRDLKKSTETSYDLIIVGGGIYGIMLSFEAVRRHLRPLLLEKHDFINATSLNHLRTVHGGVRYLQSMDLHRFRESVQERKWFLKHFPQFVRVMPCLMPLYGRGLHRNTILRLALMANDMLSFNRNTSIDDPKQQLPGGRVISPQKTKALFPAVDDRGLTGSALWYDAHVEEHQRLMMELLKLAVASGAEALNYVKVKALLKKTHRILGVQAIDEETGTGFEFKAPIVINAAGPWCREVANALDHDHEPLFKKRLLVWNVLFNKEALSTHALGLTPGKGKGHTYFFHPWKNRLLVGTGEIVVEKNDAETQVPAKEIERFIKDLNEAVPGLNLSEADLQRVYSGILPAETDGSMSKREKILDHGTNGGPKGLFSISGVKFTTSRRVADKTLEIIFPQAKKMTHEKLLEPGKNKALAFDYHWQPSSQKDLEPLHEIVQNEAVRHLSDLILRRTTLGDHPERAVKILNQIRPVFDWDDKKWATEVENVLKDLTSGGQGALLKNRPQAFLAPHKTFD